MATIEIRGQTRHGELSHSITVPDAALGPLVAAVVDFLHRQEEDPPRADKRKPTLPHQAKARRPGSGMVYLTESVAASLYKKVPTVDEVVKHIQNTKDRTHSLSETAVALMGRAPKANSTARSEKRAFFKLQGRMVDARHLIERDDKSGEFVHDKVAFGKPRVYRWKRN